VTSVEDLRAIKVVMLRRLDATLRRNYHQTLPEVLNELRIRSIVSQPDPSPDKVFSIILQSHLLAYRSAPSVIRLKEAMERITHGVYGVCIRCGHDIESRDLLKDPTLSSCSICRSKQNN